MGGQLKGPCVVELSHAHTPLPPNPIRPLAACAISAMSSRRQMHSGRMRRSFPRRCVETLTEFPFPRNAHSPTPSPSLFPQLNKQAKAQIIEEMGSDLGRAAYKMVCKK